MKSLQECSMNFNPRMKVNFDGGDLTSDAGLLLYKEFDHKLGLSKTVKQLLVVHDPIWHRDHPNHDVVLQKLYQHLAGYHTDDHADSLAMEPLLTAIFGKERLASQPTISRFNEKVSIDTAKSLEKINEVAKTCIYHRTTRSVCLRSGFFRFCSLRQSTWGQFQLSLLAKGISSLVLL